MRKSKKVIATATSALLAGGIAGGLAAPSYAATTASNKNYSEVTYYTSPAVNLVCNPLA